MATTPWPLLRVITRFPVVAYMLEPLDKRIPPLVPPHVCPALSITSRAPTLSDPPASTCTNTNGVQVDAGGSHVERPTRVDLHAIRVCACWIADGDIR